MDGKTYYDILGVKPDAARDEIRQAYRRLAKQYHPDVCKLEDAEKTFMEIKRAYETLYDDRERAKYDEELKNKSQRTASFEDASNAQQRHHEHQFHDKDNRNWDQFHSHGHSAQENKHQHSYGHGPYTNNRFHGYRHQAHGPEPNGYGSYNDQNDPHERQRYRPHENPGNYRPHGEKRNSGGITNEQLQRFGVFSSLDPFVDLPKFYPRTRLLTLKRKNGMRVNRFLYILVGLYDTIHMLFFWLFSFNPWRARKVMKLLVVSAVLWLTLHLAFSRHFATINIIFFSSWLALLVGRIMFLIVFAVTKLIIFLMKLRKKNQSEPQSDA